MAYFSNSISRAQHHVGWPKYDLTSKHVLQIGTFNASYLGILENEIFTPIVTEDRNENCAFWNELMPKLMEFNDNECKDKITEITKFLPLNPSADNLQKSPLFVNDAAYKIIEENVPKTTTVPNTYTTTPSTFSTFFTMPNR